MERQFIRRRFKRIERSEGESKRFLELLDEKELTNDELVLILRNVKLNEGKMLEIKALKFDGTNIYQIVQFVKGGKWNYEEETLYVVLPDNKCQIIHKNEYAMIIKREQGYSVCGLADFAIEDYPIYKD